MRFDAFCALFTDKSKSCPLNINVPPPPPPIISLSLSKGATTSGFDLAPGYSPIKPYVGPLIIPPSANLLGIFEFLPLEKFPSVDFEFVKLDFNAAPAATAAIPAATAKAAPAGVGFFNDSHAANLATPNAINCLPNDCSASAINVPNTSIASTFSPAKTFPIDSPNAYKELLIKSLMVLFIPFIVSVHVTLKLFILSFEPAIAASTLINASAILSNCSAVYPPTEANSYSLFL